MGIASQEFLFVTHLLLGALFFYFFMSGLRGLVSKSTQRVRTLLNGTWNMAVTAWVAVLISTWVVYPWRSSGPAPGTSASPAPGSFTLSLNSCLSQGHQFAMAWIAPILATTIAVIVFRYGAHLYREAKVRRALSVLLILAFLTATVTSGVSTLIRQIVHL